MVLTSRQVERPEKAMQLYNILGTLSIRDFKAIITINVIKNLPVNIEDSNLAQHILVQNLEPWKAKQLATNQHRSLKTTLIS
jgi:hypothetical protein